MNNDYVPFWKKKKINKFLKKYNLINIVIPNMNHELRSNIEIIYDCLSNPFMYLLIIESMCIGILMNKHIIYKFCYVKNVEKYNNIDKANLNKINIINIGDEWDTSRFNIDKINRFYYDSVPYILDKNISQIKQLDNYILQKIDIHFLEALSWEPNTI